METINIPRPTYLNAIVPFIDKNIIKVLTGQRRVGKSYILKSVEKEILKTNHDPNFININLEDFAFSHINDASQLYDEITKSLSANKKNYIFIDEIQEVKDFDKVIRSLNLDPRNDIYVTGSNSAMLSTEIASRLAGRSIEIRVHPLSYCEFLKFHSFDNSDISLEKYLRYGGMPYLRNLPSISTWEEYLSGITDAIVFRDIVSRHSIRNTDFLSRMLMFLADNIGQIFTSKSISDYLKAQHINGTPTSVQSYADYICEACVINKVSRWDIAGKKLFEIGEKYYFEDLGIRNVIIGYRPMDIGKILENAVFNHLISEGYDVKIGVLGKGKEIDFIVEKGGERKYIQVSLDINNPTTAVREFGNLTEIPDNYEKVVVTLRDSAPNTYQGIRMLSLREFLVSSDKW
ncbi:MAG: ATP-binding protein [Muribaculaceae bacterium]|nr:ATP-binding protein [Muribaculaceae bacterium]